MRTKLLACLVTAAMVAGSGTAFAAETARASGNISIYDGPGTRYEVIGTLRKNTRVTLDRCTRNSNWCLINDRNGDPAGWVRGSYLIGIGAITRATPFRFLSNPEFIPNP